MHVAALSLDDRLPIIRVQLGKRFAPDDPARVVRDGDDVFDHHILGVDVEEVGPVDQTLESLGDNLEVGPHRGIGGYISR